MYEDSEANRIKKCKVLGRDLRNAIPADILDFLIETAEKDPNKVIQLYEGEDWKLQLFILDAIDNGVIKKSDGIYKYDDKMLGGSMDAVVNFLKDIRYKKLIDSMKMETYPELFPKTSKLELDKELIRDLPQFSEEEPKPTRTAGSKKL